MSGSPCVVSRLASLVHLARWFLGGCYAFIALLAFAISEIAYLYVSERRFLQSAAIVYSIAAVTIIWVFRPSRLTSLKGLAVLIILGAGVVGLVCGTILVISTVY
jgi:hypothetical protein